MKLNRLQICVIIVGCCLLAYHAVPLVEANPVLGTIVKPIVKPILKKIATLLKSGEIDAAHKSVEKAIQKIKDNPATYGFTATEVAGVTVDCIATFTEKEDSTTYEVKVTANDDEQRFEFYVNGECTGVIAYEDYNKFTEDEVATKIDDAKKNAISMYKMRHPSGT